MALATSALFLDADVWEERSELWSVVGLIVGFGIGAAYCFGEYFLTRGTYDDDRIDFYTPWTGRKAERWSELRTVELNSSANWYVLIFGSGRKVRISSLLSGHGAILSLVHAKGFLLDGE